VLFFHPCFQSCLGLPLTLTLVSGQLSIQSIVFPDFLITKYQEYSLDEGCDCPYYPRKKPRELLPWRVPVTIAAGFNFNEGILLCADKKHSAQMKLAASKIFRKTYDDGSKSIIVIAGNVMYARMGMQSMEALIEAIPRSDRTAETMAARIREAVRVLHHAHLFKHPDRPDAQYIIGLWSPSGGLKLLTTEDTAVNEMRGYDCVGAGAYLGHYLMRLLYQQCDKSFHDVLAIAIHALARIKSYDDACGGDSEFTVLTKTGEMLDIQTLEIAKVEKYSTKFDEGMAKFFLTVSRPGMTQEESDEVDEQFSEILSSVLHQMVRTRVFEQFAKKLNPSARNPQAASKGSKS